jgi:hypothetical protein
MREDNYPDLISDPEADGIPGYADDDSSAYDDVETGREADGPDPAALPSNEPVAVDRYGVTAEEQRIGESLDLKIARETPDPASYGEPRDRTDATQSPIAAEAFDADPAGAETDALDRETALVEDDVPVEPRLNSQVSMYDLDDPDFSRPIGRIVEPDEGGVMDTEKDAVAYDAGAAGGGATAEELAMHEVREPRDANETREP